MTEQTAPFVILGASGPVGCSLIRCFQEATLTADIVSRRAMTVPPGFRQVQIDLNGTTDWKAPSGATVISFVPFGNWRPASNVLPMPRP